MQGNIGEGKEFNEEIFNAMWGKINMARLIRAATNFARNNGIIE